MTVVVVEHRDRLGRMNTELVEAALSAAGRRLAAQKPVEVAAVSPAPAAAPKVARDGRGRRLPFQRRSVF